MYYTPTLRELPVKVGNLLLRYYADRQAVGGAGGVAFTPGEGPDGMNLPCSAVRCQE
jgi:hypothetical protein